MGDEKTYIDELLDAARTSVNEKKKEKQRIKIERFVQDIQTAEEVVAGLKLELKTYIEEISLGLS